MKQAFARRPNGRRLAGLAWSSTAAAVIGLLPFFAVMMAAFFALLFGARQLEQTYAIAPPAGSLASAIATRDGWFFLALGLANVVLAVPISVATQRAVLVDDGPRLAPGPLLRVLLWALLSALLALGALYLSGLARTPQLFLLTLFLKMIAAVVPLLLLLVFPALAAGAPATGLFDRLDTGLAHWEGNLWLFLAAIFLTFVPVILAFVIVNGILKHGGGAPLMQRLARGWGGMAATAILTPLLIALGAAVLAWCYAWARQPKPPQS